MQCTAQGCRAKFCFACSSVWQVHATLFDALLLASLCKVPHVVADALLRLFCDHLLQGSLDGSDHGSPGTHEGHARVSPFFISGQQDW